MIIEDDRRVGFFRMLLGSSKCIVCQMVLKVVLHGELYEKLQNTRKICDIIFALFVADHRARLRERSLSPLDKLCFYFAFDRYASSRVTSEHSGGVQSIIKSMKIE